MFFASCVFPLVGEAGLEGSAGFLEGRASAFPLVGGMGFGPLVRSAMSRGMSRGGCGLRKSLGSLSANGWSCVPAQLIVGSEASQHWHLQDLG